MAQESNLLDFQKSSDRQKFQNYLDTNKEGQALYQEKKKLIPSISSLNPSLVAMMIFEQCWNASHEQCKPLTEDDKPLFNTLAAQPAATAPLSESKSPDSNSTKPSESTVDPTPSNTAGSQTEERKPAADSTQNSQDKPDGMIYSDEMKLSKECGDDERAKLIANDRFGDRSDGVHEWRQTPPVTARLRLTKATYDYHKKEHDLDQPIDRDTYIDQSIDRDPSGGPTLDHSPLQNSSFLRSDTLPDRSSGKYIVHHDKHSLTEIEFNPNDPKSVEAAMIFIRDRSGNDRDKEGNWNYHKEKVEISSDDLAKFSPADREGLDKLISKHNIDCEFPQEKSAAEPSQSPGLQP